MVFNTFKLIECVKANPSIWDKATPLISKSDREKGWKNVAENVFANWSKMTTEEMAQNMNMIKKKWRELRQRQYRLGKINKDNPQKHGFRYGKYLTFLDSHWLKRNSSSSILSEFYKKAAELEKKLEQQEAESIEKIPLESTEINDEREKVKNNEGQVDLIPLLNADDVSVQSGSLQVEPPPLPKPPQKEIRISSQRPSRRKIITRFQQPVILRRKREDADKDFLLSILPDYKMLSSDKKSDFQKFALKCLKWVELQN